MRHARLLSTTAFALASAALLGACADSAPVSGPKLIDGVNNPMLSSGQPTPADLLALNATTRTAQGELVEVCKDYVGGGATPDVTFDVSVTGSQVAAFQVVLSDGECEEIWFNEARPGETPPTPPDVVTITEQVPAGYTASLVKTSRAAGVTTVGPSVASNTTSGGVSGGVGYLVEFTNTLDVVVGGCSLTQGYWKNHSEEWDEDADPNSASFLAGTAFYDSGKTYLEIMNTPPKGGNAYLQLAHQFIAASLNVGSPASTTADVDAALSGAAAYFASSVGLPNPTGALRTQLQGWASTLGSYNEGDIGPGHCED